MFDAGMLPPLVVGAVIGAVTAVLWGRWKNRSGSQRPRQQVSDAGID